MKRLSIPRALIACAMAVACHSYLAAADLADEIRTMFVNGAWKRALATLEKTPDSQTNPALRELLGMAYLYSASDIDSVGNMEKARTLMKLSVDQGGKARFLVSLGQDRKKEANLVEAIPGELIVTSAAVEFQPQSGIARPASRWEKKDISECALNAKYGKTSNSFHITVGTNRDKSEQNFRPWHFSADETSLICSLIGVQPPARR